MFIDRTSVGLDVHARSVRAAAIDSVTGELIERSISPVTEQIVAFVDELAVDHGPVLVTYEAGPTGYGLARAVLAAGHRCQVAAPSKLLRPAGDRVKTDRRDALLLARLARNDDIVAVTIPTVAAESARDLVRAREDARMVLMAGRHRLSKLLLRHGHVYDGGQAWTGKHDAWLRRTRKDHLPLAGSGTLAAFDDAYDAVGHALARRDRLDAMITEQAADSEFTAVTRRLGCLRGISTTTGFALAVEIGDLQRLTGATIGSYLGLVPSESSSGASRMQGGITKTGNSHARRLLIEAAWHHKPLYQPGKTMQDRWALAPATAAARGDAGNRRLHRRWDILTAHKKRHTVANTAIARELAGWCWSLAVMDH
ncbi:IS110 family transposase [Knoellia aerolata]|uniref:Transposase IS110 n=1 Tax=Knoellia aerolata DSM 18566 TaxID=1385519 RepID=A0A0A0JYP6_9MICO|nr:IS110 family transposase [Knoellia aerolata]KGN40671.1 transposase IS110 [Knoellia aerolata DSM 18566]